MGWTRHAQWPELAQRVYEDDCAFILKSDEKLNREQMAAINDFCCGAFGEKATSYRRQQTGSRWKAVDIRWRQYKEVQFGGSTDVFSYWIGFKNETDMIYFMTGVDL